MMIEWYSSLPAYAQIGLAIAATGVIVVLMVKMESLIERFW